MSAKDDFKEGMDGIFGYFKAVIRDKVDRLDLRGILWRMKHGRNKRK